ncbi:C2H2-type zinc finger protein [Pyrobaculum sp.]|uniref:C2H2-type zinc finger protein n=1 Tax=Pyrobaculum sp. TaxID=2004705 RepID=UPI003F4FF9C6
MCKKEVSWREAVTHYMGHGKKSGNDVVCPICNTKVKQQEYRNHVRRHFAAKRGLSISAGSAAGASLRLDRCWCTLSKTHE